MFYGWKNKKNFLKIFLSDNIVTFTETFVNVTILSQLFFHRENITSDNNESFTEVPVNVTTTTLLQKNETRSNPVDLFYIVDFE